MFHHLLPLSLRTGFARIRKETTHASQLMVLVQPYRSMGDDTIQIAEESKEVGMVRVGLNPILTMKLV